MKNYSRLPGVLEKLGFDSLREHQSEPIQLAMRGVDQLVILPTGGGKSAIYIIPTLCCDYKTLIFSPLVALIKDQLDGLLKKGMSAGAVSSLYTKTENDRTLNEWKRGGLDFLFVAPERLNNEDFLRALRTQPPDMVAVDEIHVASEHAFNFRPAYRSIAPFVAELNPGVFLGLTATMPVSVEEDLRKIFDVPDARKTVAYYERTNLRMKGVDALSNTDLLKWINSIGGACIVYFSTINRLEDRFNELRDRVEGGACMYHGSMTPAQKDSSQNMFMNDDIRVVFATASFGMGVDKDSIRGVIYATIPGSVEEVAQGFGRGGRDGFPCECVFTWDESTLSTQEFFIEMGYPPKEYVKKFHRTVKENADSEGLCHLKVGDICRLAGVQGMYAQAMSSILVGEGVLQRVHLDKPIRVKPLEEPKTKASKKYVDRVMELGIRSDDGFYEIEGEFLASQLGVQPGQVGRMFNRLDKEGAVKFRDPGNVKPLKITGDISLMDFKKLQQRRNDAYKRLGQAREFWETPDNKKHEYLRKHFAGD